MGQIEEKISFCEWFDVDNMEHLKAWQHLEKEGTWPKHFVPADVEMNNNWYLTCQVKMADAWLELKTRGSKAR